MKYFLLLFPFFVAPLSAIAQNHDYKCFSYSWNGGQNEKGTMLLSVNAESATADILEELWDTNLGGPINKTYKSRSKLKHMPSY
ncbi:MAG: hypothetical protein EOO38_22345 [Cytophagaceae bacterium]|nr:MAG: hypothetical protein EOO38_22345 [Cytophagaceae bacterium]